ncbi:MAG: hypothetical protein M1833_003061 [Piccolia ochrophora]|nr:MAG: hypothetical protein M1833_003061 [Piccolia ochrophora]
MSIAHSSLATPLPSTSGLISKELLQFCTGIFDAAEPPRPWPRRFNEGVHVAIDHVRRVNQSGSYTTRRVLRVIVGMTREVEIDLETTIEKSIAIPSSQGLGPANNDSSLIKFTCHAPILAVVYNVSHSKVHRMSMRFRDDNDCLEVRTVLRDFGLRVEDYRLTTARSTMTGVSTPTLSASISQSFSQNITHMPRQTTTGRAPAVDIGADLVTMFGDQSQVPLERRTTETMTEQRRADKATAMGTNGTHRVPQHQYSRKRPRTSYQAPPEPSRRSGRIADQKAARSLQSPPASQLDPLTQPSMSQRSRTARSPTPTPKQSKQSKTRKPPTRGSNLKSVAQTERPSLSELVGETAVPVNLPPSRTSKSKRPASSQINENHSPQIEEASSSQAPKREPNQTSKPSTAKPVVESAETLQLQKPPSRRDAVRPPTPSTAKSTQSHRKRSKPPVTPLPATPSAPQTSPSTSTTTPFPHHASTTTAYAYPTPTPHQPFQYPPPSSTPFPIAPPHQDLSALRQDIRQDLRQDMHRELHTLREEHDAELRKLRNEVLEAKTRTTRTLRLWSGCVEDFSASVRRSLDAFADAVRGGLEMRE